MKTLSILGPGRVGKALGRVLSQSGGVTILDILGRDPGRVSAAAAFIGAGKPITDVALLRPADIYLVSVPDDAIAVCGAMLAAHLTAGAVVFHCSGALTSAALEPVRSAGARPASLHPVRSFADPQQVADHFSGTGCGIEGDADAVALLRSVFEAAGARIFSIDAAGKTLYHAAAVFASNYVVTLIDVAMQTYAGAGIATEDALALIGPLLRESAENAVRLGPAAALTGPIARGDTATVLRQQAALAASNPDHAALYAALASATGHLAAQQRRLSTSPQAARNVPAWPA